MSSPKVAIVILNWNGRHYLQKFLPSVVSSLYDNLDIVVADNGSTDDSVSFLRDNYPQVRLILLPVNYGFTKGYNEALKQVEATYYVLLNSDVETGHDWIRPMVGLLESNPVIAACQPKILAYSNKELFEYAGAAGGWMDSYGYPFSKGRVFEICEEDHGQYDTAAPIFWASGAALFIRSSVYREQHGFDDFFFAHMEEIDLCWRIQLSGYEVWSCPESVVYHVGGGTLPRGNSRKTFLNFRNNHIMLWKNLTFTGKLRVFPVRLILDGVTGLKALAGGDGGTFKAIIRAHWAFFRWVLTGPAPFSAGHKPGAEVKGIFRGNVAWMHFIKKKKTFSEIVQGWL